MTDLPPDIAKLSGPDARAMAAQQRTELDRLRQDASRPKVLSEWTRDLAFRIGKRLADWGSS